ncbi:hypothetical protein [Archangium sp.]|uniref:hypothetical protein n=1 Tax=Archangium sp. TaxID=1872627 RepID=UPI002D3F2E28|nr:hypothetical protein [Archangium sp.]HYO59472.1 hypothetical protein [Archangium sp.]
MKLYEELADWWPLVSAPAEYREEADEYIRLLRAAASGPLENENARIHLERIAWQSHRNANSSSQCRISSNCAGRLSSAHSRCEVANQKSQGVLTDIWLYHRTEGR